MNNESSSSTGIIVGVLVVVVIAVVGWVAYSQGFFQAKEETKNDDSGFQINIGGSSGSDDSSDRSGN